MSNGVVWTVTSSPLALKSDLLIQDVFSWSYDIFDDYDWELVIYFMPNSQDAIDYNIIQDKKSREIVDTDQYSKLLIF